MAKADRPDAIEQIKIQMKAKGVVLTEAQLAGLDAAGQ